MHPNSSTATAAISGGGGSGRINADELHQMDSVDLEGVVGLEDLGDFGGDVGQFDSLMDGRGGGGFSAAAVPQRASQVHTLISSVLCRFRAEILGIVNSVVMSRAAEHPVRLSVCSISILMASMMVMCWPDGRQIARLLPQ